MVSSIFLPLLAAAIAPVATHTQFEAVLAQDSATHALEQWCEARHIASPPVIQATKLPVTRTDPPAYVRRRLKLSSGDTVALRHVQLSCGGTTLSVAWNWYVPARLTPAMNAALQATDTPFGKVVAPLDFRREPLPTKAGSAGTCPRDTISTHRARLMRPDGRPLAFVIECYTPANLKQG